MEAGNHRVEKRVLQIMGAALVIGILSGFAEVLILGVRRHLLGQLVWNVGPFEWMTPVGYAIILSVVGAVLSLGHLLLPRAIRVSTARKCLLALGAFGLLSMWMRLHPASTLVLAIGIGALGGRALDHLRLDPGGKRTLAASAILLTCVALVSSVAAASGTRVPSSDARPGTPNVLLIIWDTVRAENLSLYGYGRPTTPFLERLGRDAVVFDRAIATAPWTLPSHASVFTGHDAHELAANWKTPLEHEPPTLAEVLGERGFVTAGFTANAAYTDVEKGLARGFDVYADHRRSVTQFVLSTALGQALCRWMVVLWQADGPATFFEELASFQPGPGRYVDERTGAAISGEFLQWLEREEHRPFFAFLNYMDAHEPHHAPDDIRARFWTGQDPFRDGYDAAIRHLDSVLSDLLRDLGERGELEETIVVLASDHGELLGEHGLWRHGQSLYLPVLHVPLLVLAPGSATVGIRVQEPVSLRDLPATLIDLAGLEASSLGGRSLATRWSGETRSDAPVLAEVREGINAPDHHPNAAGDMASLLTEQHHLIVDGNGHVQLFNYRADPEEIHDLADHDPITARLLNTLRAARAARPPP